MDLFSHMQQTSPEQREENRHQQALVFVARANVVAKGIRRVHRSLDGGYWDGRAAYSALLPEYGHWIELIRAAEPVILASAQTRCHQAIQQAEREMDSISRAMAGAEVWPPGLEAAFWAKGLWHLRLNDQLRILCGEESGSEYRG
jgi:hypothetical protein